MSSSLAYSFGFYSFGYLSSWLGWGGLSFFIFAIIGIGFKNPIRNLILVILKKVSSFRKHPEMADEERVDGERRVFLQHSINIGIVAPMAFFPFSGMKDSFLGILHTQGREAVRFFTESKVVIQRWF